MQENGIMKMKGMMAATLTFCGRGTYFTHVICTIQQSCMEDIAMLLIEKETGIPKG